MTNLQLLKTERVCNTCGVSKPVSEFHKPNKKDCKDCRNEARRGARQAENNYDPKTWKQSQKRDYQLRSNYGITLEEYNRNWSEQEGCCYVCGVHETVYKKSLAVDHNHETGQVRSLLCGKCNTALGQVDESIERLQALIDYLGEHKNG
jgi:hypothetical protein